MTIPINRDFDHSVNDSFLESKTPEANNEVMIDIPHDAVPSSGRAPSPSAEVVSSWQRMFCCLPGDKKSIQALTGVAGLGGASVLAAGLSKDDQELIIVGSSAYRASFLMALSTVFPRQKPTQTMDSVIAQLHQLVDRYPDLDAVGDDDVREKFEIILRAILCTSIEDIPVSARDSGNGEVLLGHCHDVFMKFSSSDEYVHSEGTATIKTIIKNVVQNFCENAKEVDARIGADKQIIHDTFFKNQQSLETFQVKFDSGETHHHGKLVAFVTFNGDDKQRIVYKPRDMRIDAVIAGSNGGFNTGLFQLVNTLVGNQSQIMPTYKFLNMEKDDKRYGYTEFLSHEPGDYKLTFNEMRAYYQAIGAIQAVSQLFGITDLHRQNILVHDKKPFPIDLEVSFDLQALQQGKEASTGLDNAIREYGIPTLGGGSKDTPNKVELVGDDGETITMQQHYQENKNQYMSEIKQGFDVVKNALVKNDAQNDLEAFIKAIPDDLQIRFVPLRTGDLLQIMSGRIDMAAYVLMSSLNESCRHRPPYQIKSLITEREVLDDVLHADIPRMVADMQGNVYYNGCYFLEATAGDIKSILLVRVKQAVSMFLNENFIKSLGNFNQN